MEENSHEGLKCDVGQMSLIPRAMSLGNGQGWVDNHMEVIKGEGDCLPPMSPLFEMELTSNKFRYKVSNMVV